MFERDKFLTEAIGECWHEWKEVCRAGNCWGYHECQECGKLLGQYKPVEQNNFSTWQGLGKLWEWATQQEWWYLFLYTYGDGNNIYYRYINPTKFADAVYEFLKKRSK